MKKVVAFGASTSKESINKQLATYATSLFENATTEVLDLNDYPTPMYSIDNEVENGIPESINAFAQKIDTADLILISFAEHNGAYTAAFKNIFDWLSRMKDRNQAWNGKNMLLLATSPGARGAESVLSIAKNRFPYNNGHVLNTFSLPSFYENFSHGKGIVNEKYDEELKSIIKEIENR